MLGTSWHFCPISDCHPTPWPGPRDDILRGGRGQNIVRRVEGDGSLIQEEGRFQGALGSELVTGEPGGRRVLEESSQRPRHQGVEKVPQAGSPEQVWANHGGRTREEQGAPPPPLARAPGSTHGRPVSELTASPWPYRHRDQHPLVRPPLGWRLLPYRALILPLGWPHTPPPEGKPPSN